jgi:glycerate kinase
MILAFGAFKGVATSSRTGHALAAMLRDANPRHAPAVRPLADGGEGTLEAFHHYLGGSIRREVVFGPMGSRVAADVLWLDSRTAVVESSQVVGYSLVRPERRDPWQASTFGVGELIARAAARGATTVYVTMGDSIVMDMGLGALRALGAQLLDRSGRPLPLSTFREAWQIEEIALPVVDDGLTVRILSDTRDYLVGEHGQVAVYGSQKGLRTGDHAAMAATADHVSRIFTKAFGRPVGNVPFSSGSGGLAAALHGYYGASLGHCVEWLFARTAIRDEIQSGRAVVTGEGSLDAQTRWGKIPWMVARLRPARLIVVAGSSTTEGRADIRAAAPESDVDFVDAPIDGLAVDAWLRTVYAAVVAKSGVD